MPVAGQAGETMNVRQLLATSEQAVYVCIMFIDIDNYVIGSRCFAEFVVPWLNVWLHVAVDTTTDQYFH